jgi:hypothetical protein
MPRCHQGAPSAVTTNSRSSTTPTAFPNGAESGRATLELVNVGEPPFGSLRTVRVVCGPDTDPARLVRAIVHGTPL